LGIGQNGGFSLYQREAIIDIPRGLQGSYQQDGLS
jgi:hypothetical protein